MLVGTFIQRGMMIWREDQRAIYAIANSGRWKSLQDQWLEGMPEYSCPGDPPGGLMRPKRGFGLAWCRDSQIRDLLGWASQEEWGATAYFQPFDGGEVLEAPDGVTYLLHGDGSWLKP